MPPSFAGLAIGDGAVGAVPIGATAFGAAPSGAPFGARPPLDDLDRAGRAVIAHAERREEQHAEIAGALHLHLGRAGPVRDLRPARREQRRERDQIVGDVDVALAGADVVDRLGLEEASPHERVGIAEQHAAQRHRLVEERLDRARGARVRLRHEVRVPAREGVALELVEDPNRRLRQRAHDRGPELEEPWEHAEHDGYGLRDVEVDCDERALLDGVDLGLDERERGGRVARLLGRRRR